MMYFCAIAWNISRSERTSLEHPFQDLFYSERETVGLGHAFNFRFAITGPQNGCELTESVEALVIHLDDNNAFERSEYFFEAIRQRMKMAQMHGASFLAVFTGH